MFELVVDALKGLTAYPLLQAILSVITIFGLGAMVFRKGQRDRRSVENGNGFPSTGAAIPNWILFGPVADAIKLLHSVEEHLRIRNDEDHRRHAEWVRETRAQTELLEDIRNLLEQRYDPSTAHPNSPRRKRLKSA